MIIDVSSNNPATLPDFATGVIVKLSQGMSYVDPFADSFLTQARARNLPVAGYHYCDTFNQAELQVALNRYATFKASYPELQYLMLDVETAQALSQVRDVAKTVTTDVPLRIYGSISRNVDLSRAGLPIMVAWFQASGTTPEQALATFDKLKADNSNVVALQWTDNYQGYDAWVGDVLSGVAVTTATSEPVSVTDGDPIGSVEINNATVDVTAAPALTSIVPMATTITWANGSNGKGWVQLAKGKQIVAVIAETTTDPRTTTESDYYPCFVVNYSEAEPIVSWSGANPKDSEITFTVLSLG